MDPNNPNPNPGSDPNANPNPNPGQFNWGEFRRTLGDLGKEKSLDPVFASEKVGESLVKGYVDAQKLIGGSIRIPAKDMKPEDRTKAVNEILTKLKTEGILEGAPKTPGEYTFEFPQDMEVKKPFFEAFQKVAHELDIPVAKARKFVSWYLERQYEEDLAEQNEMLSEKEILKKEWGPLYNKKHELSRRAATKYIGDDAESVFADLPAKVGSRIVRAFSAIGEALAEHDLISGEVPGGQSLDEVKAKIEAIQKEKNGPAFDTSAPGHAAANKELQNLISLYTRLGGKWGK